MSQNIMKFSGANWYAVKTFTKILSISETNGIYLDNNAKVIESNLKSLARNTADSSNGFTELRTERCHAFRLAYECSLKLSLIFYIFFDF